ncbi:MAG: pitrilysin family protein [Stappiaceae bacterium]
MSRIATLVSGLATAGLLIATSAAISETKQSTAGTAAKSIEQTVPVFGPNVSSFTLDNGLEVVVIPDHRAPVVTHMIWYKVGSADEAPGESGIAHFLEHLLFKGTKNHPQGEFDRVVAENGGQQNAFTSYDYTGYFQRIAREHLKLMMEYESDRMANLVLTEEIVAPERKVVLEERASRIDNNPGSQLSEIVSSALFVNHPYSSPIIGWEDEIKQLSLDEAIAFYDKYYTPNNAILVVAGDVEEDEVRTLAEATYGKIKRRADPPARDRPQVQRLLAERIVTLNNDRVQQPSTQKSWIVPSELTAEGDEALALSVLSNVLGGGATSRLYKKLVVEEQIATSAGAWYSGTDRDDTRFVVYASPRGETTLEQLQEALQVEINKIAENGIEEKELDRAKRNVLAEVIYAQDSQSYLARTFGSALATGATIEDVQTWPARMQKVTRDDVKAAAAKYITGQGAVVGNLVGTKSTPEKKS